MYFLLLTLNLMMSMIFLFLKHPMSMGFILMIQTILISLISGFYSYSFWFSYILFLIMVGGMLVLFIYMTSLASNETFNFSKNIIMSILILMSITFIMYLMIDQSIIISFLKNTNLNEMINNFYFQKNDNIHSLNMIYNNPNMWITLFLINYLFLTLVAVVKITNFFEGPLRQKF